VRIWRLLSAALLLGGCATVAVDQPPPGLTYDEAVVCSGLTRATLMTVQHASYYPTAALQTRAQRFAVWAGRLASADGRGLKAAARDIVEQSDYTLAPYPRPFEDYPFAELDRTFDTLQTSSERCANRMPAVEVIISY
jgi:hypothetical protein